jgi:membrane fusion protein, multidrug efflux system
MNMTSRDIGPSFLRVGIVAALLLLAGCGKSDKPAEAEKEAAETPGLTLKAEEVASLGITVQPAEAAQFGSHVSGYGVVTALDTIAQADSDFLTAQAAAAQSQAAAARARSLSTGEDAAVSREVAEAAQSKAAADAAALALARRKTEAAFGLRSPWRDAATRQALMQRLAAGATVLVRVSFPATGGAAPRNLEVSRMGADSKTWKAHTVWDAPADAAVPGRSFYALVDGSDLAQNERVTAAIPTGAAQAGANIPAKALVFGESEAWVYVQTAPRTFLRTKVDISHPMGEGYFVTVIKPGDKIVVGGAGLLLAHEVNPSTEAGD